MTKKNNPVSKAPEDQKGEDLNDGIPKPPIDEQYWLDYSKTLVDGSIDRIDNGIEKVRVLLEWAYGIYTGAAILTIDQKQIQSIPLLILIASPYLILLIALWKANVAGFPVDASFNENSPTWIRKAFINIYSEKQKALKDMGRISLLALCAMGLSLVIAYVISQRPNNVVENYFELRLTELKKDHKQLAITGHLPSDKMFHVIVIQFDSTRIIDTLEYIPVNTHSGEFVMTYPVDSCTTKAKTRIEWREDDTFYSMLKDTQSSKKQAKSKNTSTVVSSKMTKQAK